MPRSGNRQQRRPRRNQPHRRFHLRNRPESIARPMNKQRRRSQLRKVPGSHHIRPLRRMQRIRQQQKRFGKAGFGRRQHRSLPSPIGMAAQKDAAFCLSPQRGNRRTQAGLVAFSASARRRPAGTQLTKRQIASQHHPSGFAKGVRQSHQQRRLAVGSGAVSQHQAVRPRGLGAMEESPNRVILCRSVQELTARFHRSRRLRVLRSPI